MRINITKNRQNPIVSVFNNRSKNRIARKRSSANQTIFGWTGRIRRRFRRLPVLVGNYADGYVYFFGTLRFYEQTNNSVLFERRKRNGI